jgi:hypothetical protein
MTLAEELTQDIWEMIDDVVLSLSIEDYIKFLEQLKADAERRVEIIRRQLKFLNYKS